MPKDKKYKLVEMTPQIISEIDRQELVDQDWGVLVQMGQDAGEVKTYTQWILGKLGDAVMQKYGDLKKYALEINQKYEVLQQYMNVYRKFISEDPDFHPSKYAGSVPWGYLQLAASKSDAPQKLIDQLHSKGADTMGSAIDQMNADKGIPKKPKIVLVWIPELNKYELILDPKDFTLIHWERVKNQLMDYLEAST